MLSFNEGYCFKRSLTQALYYKSQKPDFSKESDEPKLTYPAEVSDNSKLLDASVLDEEVSHPHNDLKALPDISIFINEKILSQIENGGEESAEELEGVEAESILGKNQNQGEEEVELENDDGGEMTQPLDLEKDVVCGSNSNTKGLE